MKAFILGVLLLTACQTAGGKVDTAGAIADGIPARTVTAELWAEQRAEAAVHAADEKGLKRAARAIQQRHQTEIASDWLLARLALQATPPLTTRETRAAVELYLMLPDADAPRLFQVLVASPRNVVRRIGWQVAVTEAGDAMGEAVSAELSKRAGHGVSDAGLSPEAARAARANDVKDAYPLMRTALMAQGHPAYARAMMELNPESAADDLLTYLAQAKPLLLLQGRLVGVNRATCVLALAHFEEEPPSLHHPNFRHLFYFAASPDEEVASVATEILAGYALEHPEDLAFLLAQLPPEVQRVFLRRIATRDDPDLSTFTSAFEAVVPPVSSGPTPGH